MDREGLCLKNKGIVLFKIMGIVAIPIILFIISTETILNGKSICLFKNLLGRECYGCGITRATFLALHFKFETAYELNKSIIIVFPLLIYPKSRS